ncbi:hypothetical protein A3Q56_03699 [Intoshia linei]|uniref:Transposase Tc1-like domain-containing protein n=1 Tax=Intoshia linei TaxID=1819745 RepID=A0A177B4E4_9BILA|nr:hypothetical protein A3Q56_03699 [Intoshia linei]
MLVREDRLLEIKAKSNFLLTANELGKSIASSSKFSPATVKRSLRRIGLFERIAVKKPYRTTLHKRKRLKWCKNRRDSSEHDWNFFVYSD